MKKVLYKCIASIPTKPQGVHIDISEDEWKNNITITLNHYETNVIKMKYDSVLMFGK